MAQRVCPYWIGYVLINPLRRLVHNPNKILAPFVSRGMTVLDIGSAMGYFTLPLARMVGTSGKVIAVDVQEKMLAALRKRARAAELSDRIVTRLSGPTSLGLDDWEGRVDFALAFAVAHEVPDVQGLFAEIWRVLKPEAYCLMAEPKFHVPFRDFEASLQAAGQNGLKVVDHPKIFRSYTALLKKDGKN
ncbi:MAG: methyltransferase domain-containing protein [Deltaproteobacteria bacterium]|nr:methyltransferase domain-containing protein [Deltaproteobacteria bacterium]